MSCRRWMHDGGLGVTQFGGERHQLSPVDELPSRFAATRHLKRQHPAKTVLLAASQRVTGMVWQPAVVDGFYRRLLS